MLDGQGDHPDSYNLSKTMVGRALQIAEVMVQQNAVYHSQN